MIVAAIDVNWTVVLAGAVTGATAIVVAWIGYLGSRLSAAAVARQSEAENERTRIQHEEDHRQKRKEVYHALLNTERGHQRLVLDRGADEEIRVEAFGPLSAYINGAMILGTKEVARQTVRLSQAVNAARGLGWELDRGQRSDEQFNAAIQTWTQARRDLIDAIRNDIAPDSAPVDWPAIEAD